MKPETVQVKLNLFRTVEIAGTWRPNEAERLAAWDLYVQLVTRVGVVPLQHGLLREALNSLYSLFGEVRGILQARGPGVAEPKNNGEYNFGYLSVAVLNYTLRPVLSYWHPVLEEWEARRPVGFSRLQHEREWPQHEALRAELVRVGTELRDFTAILARACDVPDLSTAIPGAPSPEPETPSAT